MNCPVPASADGKDNLWQGAAPVNIDDGLRAIIQRKDLGPAFAGHLAVDQKVECICEILMPLAIDSEEPDLLKRQAAGVDARLIVLQADIDKYTTRARHRRGSGAGRAHADTVDH